MTNVSGVDVRELQVNVAGSSPVISVKFKPGLPTLIDITATSASGNTLGRAIINDNDPTNNTIELADFSNFLGQIIWLRVVVHHPALNKFDFKIFLDQDNANLTTYEESGSLSTSTFVYEGFMLKGAQK